jgi:hypothetical protein
VMPLIGALGRCIRPGRASLTLPRFLRRLCGWTRFSGWSQSVDLHRGQSFGTASPRATQTCPHLEHSKPGMWTRGIARASLPFATLLREVTWRLSCRSWGLRG